MDAQAAGGELCAVCANDEWLKAAGAYSTDEDAAVRAFNREIARRYFLR